MPTGITGLDLLTKGGLPKGRTTLVQGEAGCGKTVFALQTLVHGITEFDEPGIFVTCEESSARIQENAETFDWGLAELSPEKFFLLDARPSPDTAFVGDFDLSGMLSALSAKVKEMKAKRIVFDSIDFILSFLDDPKSVRREIYRLEQWIESHGLTALLTLKVNETTGPDTDFVQFMVDCVIRLHHRVDDRGTSQRVVRIVKYRGSDFEGNETPFLIGGSGLEVAQIQSAPISSPASKERVSTGIPMLDNMLEGGYFRYSSTLVSGAPGTAKTSLCGAFAAAACERGEPTVFIGFDTRAEELVRNLASIGIDLATHLESGLLKMEWAHAYLGNAEIQLMLARKMVLAHKALNLIIDPLSALDRGGLARGGVERLVSWARVHNVTLLCTSLMSRDLPSAHSTPIEVSTLADNWIHLSYHVNAGEHNRGLSIIKARGTSHSNQLRELVLSSSGISLSQVYTGGGEVLMGTLRHEREMDLALAEQKADIQAQNERRRLKSELDALTAQVEGKKAQYEALEADLAHSEEQRKRRRSEIGRFRRGD